MGQFDPTPCPAVVTATWLNAILAAIQTAFNTHATSDFPEKCIYRNAFISHLGRSFLKVGVSGGAAIVADGYFGYMPVAKAGTITAIYGICNACAANPAATLQRIRDGVQEDIGNQITFAAAHTDYLVGGLTNTDLKPGDVLVMKIVAAGKSVTFPQMTVAVKSDHTP